MTGPLPPIGEDDLQALVDERLDPRRRALVEACVAASPDLGARLAGAAADRARLRAALAPVTGEPLPPRLRIAAVVARRRAAAVVALVAVGAAGGWIARANLPAGDPAEATAATSRWAALAGDALRAHRTYAAELAHPVEAGSESPGHLGRWISSRLGQPLSVPDLTGTGYRLLGGRILPAATGIAALILYEDAAAARLTVYIKSGETDEVAMRRLDGDGLAAVYWADDGCLYVVAAALPAPRLDPIAAAAFRQFEAQRPPAAAPTGG